MVTKSTYQQLHSSLINMLYLFVCSVQNLKCKILHTVVLPGKMRDYFLAVTSYR